MSLTSPDARAVVAAVDRLTTQVRRLADGASTPVTVAADAPTTTADDGAYALADGTEAGFRAALAATDEDAQRTARRERLHNLLARADRGTLTPGETAALRDLVDAEARDADTMRAKAGDLAGTYKAERRRGDALADERNQAWAERDAEQARLRDLLRSENQRANKAIERETTAEQAAEEARAELEQAQAALERVRALATEPGETNHYIARERLLATLDDTGQPTGCSCHNIDELCSGCHRCPDICHGCDGPDQPTTKEH